MGNKLAILAIAGLSISAVSLTAAAMVGGRELRDHGFNIFDWNDKPRCTYEGSGGAGNRSLDWSGGNSITISVDADIHYTPGSGDKIEMTGSLERLSHIHVKNGKLEFDCNGDRGEGKIRITLPGRAFRSFNVFGDGRLFLENLDQDRLDVSVTGDGSIEASGRADQLELSLIGDATARMDTLSVQEAEINIIGDGTAEVTPQDSLTSNIIGDGTIRLYNEPKEIETNTVGSGRIIHAAQEKSPI